MKKFELSGQELIEINDVLKYHENIASSTRLSYNVLCNNEDSLEICGEFLRLIEQHEKFANILSKITQ